MPAIKAGYHASTLTLPWKASIFGMHFAFTISGCHVGFYLHSTHSTNSHPLDPDAVAGAALCRGLLHARRISPWANASTTPTAKPAFSA